MRKLLPLLLCLILLTCSACAAQSQPDTFVRLTGEPLPPLPTEVWTETGTTPLTLTPEDWQDVTPPSLAGTDWRIIKNSLTCESLLVTQEGAYLLGMSFGGWGVTSAVPCDADDNGTPDLLFTYSWGSGIHRSHLAVLNLTTQELTNLAIWYEWDSDLVILPPTARAESPLTSYAITDYPVWLAELNNTVVFDYAGPPLVPAQSIGSLTIDHGLTLRLTEMENLEIVH